MPKERKTDEDYVREIYAYYYKHGKMPTQRDICKIFGFKHRNSGYYLVDKLVKKNLLEKDETGKLLSPNLMNIEFPVLGYLSAGKVSGFPNPAEEETSETMSLAELLEVGINPLATRLVRVMGDSMKDAGIHEGDVLLVECTDRWRNGDIVVAIVDGEQLVKYIRKDKKGKIYLEAANEEVSDIYPEEEMHILGVVKRTIKFHS